MKWWIKVDIKLWELENHKITEMEQWIKDNLGKRYTRSAGHFHFRTKKDAALFALKWL